MPRLDKGRILSKEMYNWYRDTVPKHVDYKTYKKVTFLWGRLACEYLLEGKDVPLYSGFKLFGIRKRYAPTYIDYKQTRIHGRKILMPNTHSNFYSARVHWRKNKTKFNVNGWMFEPNRKVSRELATVMKSPGGYRRYVGRVEAHASRISKLKKRYKL